MDAINSKDIDILDIMSVIEGSSKDENQTAVIRLATGRMICKSKARLEKELLEKGIMYLGQYSRYQEDINLLKKIKNSTGDEKIKEKAKNAISCIKRAEDEAKTSQSNLRWWRNRLGLIRN